MQVAGRGCIQSPAQAPLHPGGGVCSLSAADGVNYRLGKASFESRGEFERFGLMEGCLRRLSIPW